MYSVLFSGAGKKRFKALNHEVQERILAALDRIKVRPEEYAMRLTGYNLYRLRVGDYRVIIDIQQENHIILVVSAGHRKNVYKRV